LLYLTHAYCDNVLVPITAHYLPDNNILRVCFPPFGVYCVYDPNFAVLLGSAGQGGVDNIYYYLTGGSVFIALVMIFIVVTGYEIRMRSRKRKRMRANLTRLSNVSRRLTESTASATSNSSSGVGSFSEV